MTEYDLIGFCGVVLTIYAYARLQQHRRFARRLQYSLLNLASALLLGFSLYKSWNMAAFANNCIWGLISIYGIYKCYSSYQAKRKIAK